MRMVAKATILYYMNRFLHLIRMELLLIHNLIFITAILLLITPHQLLHLKAEQRSELREEATFQIRMHVKVTGKKIEKN